MYGIDLILPQIQEVAGTFSCLPAISAAAAEFTRAISMTFIDFPNCQLQGSMQAPRHGEKTKPTRGSETWLP
jgi:hypothetical protein